MHTLLAGTMFRFVFILSFFAGLLSCKQEDAVRPKTDRVSSVNQFLISANGVSINEFTEEGVNKTQDVAPYLFFFNPNGSVTASKAGESIPGTYLVFRDDNKTEVRFGFPINSKLHELNDDWYFISQNENTIRFEDMGDVVQFQKQ